MHARLIKITHMCYFMICFVILLSLSVQTFPQSFYYELCCTCCVAVYELVLQCTLQRTRVHEVNCRVVTVSHFCLLQ